MENLKWLAYAYFQYGEHAKALQAYQQLLVLEEEPVSTMNAKHSHACGVTYVTETLTT